MTQPARPLDLVAEDGVGFAQPWEARVFAIAVSLHERGLFTWSEWTDALASRVGAADDSDVGDAYYHHWLGALEDLLARNGIDSAEIARWCDAWRHAVNRTPHGKPIELRAEDFGAANNTRNGA